MKFNRTPSYVLALIPLLALAATTARAQESADFAKWGTDVHGSVDLTEYAKVNIEGGVGYELGLKQNWFFHKHLGLFVGADYVARKQDLNSPEKIGWLDIPVGLSFRYRGGAIEGLSGNLDLGVYFSKPLKTEAKDTRVGTLQGGTGLYFAGATLFDVSPGFQLGILVAGKFSFFSPFKKVDEAIALSTTLGLAGRYSY